MELGLRRYILVAGLLAGLGACSNPMAQMVLGGTEPAAATPSPEDLVDRRAIARADVAALLATNDTTGAAAVTIAVAARGDAVTYVSSERRSVVMRGGLIGATRGFGVNLQAVTTRANDPLVQQTPPANWPTRTRRVYHFTAHGPDYDTVTLSCRSHAGETQALDVLGVTRRGVLITETCTGGAEPITNFHFVHPQSGQVWITTQWTGPRQGAMTVRIIEPFEDS